MVISISITSTITTTMSTTLTTCLIIAILNREVIQASTLVGSVIAYIGDIGTHWGNISVGLYRGYIGIMEKLKLL